MRLDSSTSPPTPVAQNAADLSGSEWLARDGAAELRRAVSVTTPGPTTPTVIQFGRPRNRKLLFEGVLEIRSSDELESIYESYLASFGLRQRGRNNGDYVLTILRNSRA